MSKLILNPHYQLYEQKNQAFCDSLQVAETFGKMHKNVIQDIKNLGCSEEFWRLNFQPRTYTSRGKKYPMYLLTKDGFTMLVFGYTGKKAMQFKEAYIQRFNDMEAFIKTTIALRMEHPALTEAIKDAHENPQSFHYSNEFNMINRIVLGMTASQFKALHGIDKNVASIRPYISDFEAQTIERLQKVDIGLLVAQMGYEQRKQILTVHCQNKLLKAV